jgi:hypothetical protein
VIWVGRVIVASSLAGWLWAGGLLAFFAAVTILCRDR